MECLYVPLGESVIHRCLPCADVSHGDIDCFMIVDMFDEAFHAVAWCCVDDS